MAQDAEWGELAVAIDDALRTVGMALRRGHRHSPAELDLTLGQLHCLGAVGCLGEPSMSDLSSALGLRPSTVTGLVDALIERGQVERRDDAEDRRLVRVRLTAEGVQRHEHHGAQVQQRLTELLGAMPTPDLRQVRDALDLLVAAVRRSSEGADQ